MSDEAQPVPEDPTAVGDVNDLVRSVELIDIVFYEVRSRRRDAGFDDIPEADLEQLDGSSDTEPIVQWTLNRMGAVSEDGLAARFRINAVSTLTVTDVDVAVIFRQLRPITVPDEVLEGFVTHYGLLTAFPFLRERVHQVTTAAGDPVVLPFIRVAPTEADG